MLLTYTYIAPIVWKAYRMAHLPYDMLPPLPDYDHLRHLAAERFPVRACITDVREARSQRPRLQHLDPMLNRSRTHLALKLMRVFCERPVPRYSQQSC